MDITSSDGEVFVLTNGIGNITSITAGGNVTAASLSALTVNNVLTPASVILFASGPLAGISVDAQGDLQAVSMNNMHLQPVAIGPVDEISEIIEELCRRMLVDQRLQKDANAVQTDPLGVTQLTIDDVRIVIEPRLHVR